MASVDQFVDASEHERLLRAIESPYARFERWMNVPVQEFCGAIVVFLVAFLSLANLQVEKENVAMDFQVLIKLAVVGMAGCYGMLGIMGDPRIRKVLLTFPMFWMLLLSGLYFVSAFASITPKVSMASSLALLCVLLMTATAMVQLGLVRMLTIVFHAMSLFVVLSWVVFLVWPEVGVFMEPITDGEFTARMSGLAHANTLGQYAGLTLVVGVALYRFYGQRSRWRVIVIALAAGALLCSLSRTSLLATMFALTLLFRERIFRPQNIRLILAGAAIGLIALMVLCTQVDIGQALADKLTLVSKSGDAEELTSATGRADIWRYAWMLIWDQPLTGYGAATSKYFLADYSMYTHNLLLNIAFSTGVFGGLVGLGMIFGQAWRIVWQPHPITNAVAGFILLNGLFENVIFSIIAGMPTMVWMMTLAWSHVAEINGGEDCVRELSPKERFA